MTEPGPPCLVVGARGMLGTDLVKALQENRFSPLGVDVDELDITDAAGVAKTVSAIRPHTVINVAALTDVDGCESRADDAYRINAAGAENLARACAAQRAYLVHLSTDYVFDGTKSTPYREDDPMSPLGVYGTSKAEGEALVRRVLPDNHCIVRTQWLYGIHGKNFVETILSLCAQRDVLRVVDDQVGSPTYTVDLAEALVRLCLLRYVGTIHVTNHGATSWHGFAEAIVALSGRKGVRVETMTTDELKRPAPRPLYSVLDGSRYSAVTGSSLRPWQEALADYFRHREA
jgi:dTDP-4-dehydrorhamnose reductase